jgi:hypothetical protein
MYNESEMYVNKGLVVVHLKIVSIGTCKLAIVRSACPIQRRSLHDPPYKLCLLARRDSDVRIVPCSIYNVIALA